MEYIQTMWELALEKDSQGFLFFFVHITLFAMLGSSLAQWRINQWHSTRGKLLGAYLDQVGMVELSQSDQGYEAGAAYEYTVDGTTYQGDRVMYWVVEASHNAKGWVNSTLNKIQKRTDANGNITVYYNPKKPKDSMLFKPSLFSRYITLSIGLIPFYFYWSVFGWQQVS